MVRANSVMAFWLAVRLMQLIFHRPLNCHLVNIGFKMKLCIRLKSDEGR